MKTRNKGGVFMLAALFTFSLFTPGSVLAATTPSLGAADTYGVLVDTYTNAVPGTTINGDIGFTTPPAIIPAGTHTNYGSGAPYAAARADTAIALANLNAQACTFTFAPGAVDLATDVTHGPMGVYTPGVYCASSILPWVSLGAGGITLSGSGTYIFRINGSLISAASSSVTLTNGASACDIFWTIADNAVISALGANSTFAGSFIDTVRLDIRTNVAWVGRALLPDGAVSTVVDDTITAPSGCTPPPVVPPVVVPPPVVTPPLVIAPPPAAPPVVTPPTVVVSPTTTPAVLTLAQLPNTGHNLVDELWQDFSAFAIPSAIFALLCSLYLFKRRV